MIQRRKMSQFGEAQLSRYRLATFDAYTPQDIAAFLRSHTDWETANSDISLLLSAPHYSLALIDNQDDILVGTAAAIRVTKQLAFLCYVVISRKHRKLGLARYITLSLMEKLKSLGFDKVQLVASQDGFPVYDKLGFVRIPLKITLSYRYATPDRVSEAFNIVCRPDVTTALSILSEVTDGDGNEVRENFLRQAVEEHHALCVVVDGNSACCWGRESRTGELLVGPVCANSVEAAQMAIRGILDRWNKGDTLSARSLVIHREDSDMSTLAFEAMGFHELVTVPLMQYNLHDSENKDVHTPCLSPRYLAMTGFELF